MERLPHLPLDTEGEGKPLPSDVWRSGAHMQIQIEKSNNVWFEEVERRGRTTTTAAAVREV